MRGPSGFRRTVFSLIAAVLVAVIAYSAYWYHMARKLRDELAPWAKAQAAEGYDLRWDKAETSGFPGAFRFDLTHVSLGTARPLPMMLDAATASIWAMPWNLKHWDFTAPSGARVALPSGIAGFSSGRLDGAVDFGSASATQIDIAALDLDGIGAAQGFGIGDATLHIELPNTPVTSHTETALAVSLQLDQTRLPQPVPGFGSTLSGFSLAAQQRGALPPGPFLAALGRWRDDGGTVELQSLRLRGGSLLLDASGTLALDPALQPEGAFSAMITGQDAALDAAVTSGSLKRDQAGAVKAVLGLLEQANGTKDAAGEDKPITLPITIENQRLYIGPAKLAELPTISWQ